MTPFNSLDLLLQFNQDTHNLKKLLIQFVHLQSQTIYLSL